MEKNLLFTSLPVMRSAWEVIKIKVLAIIGSPRKGDSYRITKLVEKRLKSLRDVEFKYLFLKDANLEFCLGCNNCMAKGEEFCPIKDDALTIRDEMLNSDGVIFVSPVYINQVTGLMKNFLDRFVYLLHRPRFFDKSAMVISTTIGSGLKEVLGYLELNARLLGFYVHKLGVIAPTRRYTPKYKNKITSEIDKASRKFFEAIKTKRRPSPNLHEKTTDPVNTTIGKRRAGLIKTTTSIST